MPNFDGRISFVTGAGSGIGQAMALTLAAEGSTVVCSDINEQTAQATAARVEEIGAKGVANALDTADEEAVKEALIKTQRDLGRLDVLMNNAGVAGEDWDTVIQTANEETLLVVQMESQQAYDNLDEIKQVPGIDAIMVGPLDLSATVGTLCDTNSPQVQDIMEDVPKRLEGTGLVTATTLADVADIQQKVRWGYRFLNVGSALNYGTQALAGHFETLRANPRGIQ